MTAKTPVEIIDQVFSLYDDGLSFNEISKIVGVGKETIRKHFKMNGCVARKTAQGRPSPNTINNLPEESICNDYMSGVSENELSKRHLTSRAVISRILKKNNVPRRNQSESEYLKWSQMTDEQRHNQVRACHTATIGRINTIEHREKIALARQANTPTHYIGVGEDRLKEILLLGNVEFEYQKPVLGYNLDFFVSNVAIELTSFTGRNSSVKKPQQKRALNIFNHSGIHTLAVEITSEDDIDLFYSQIMCAVSDLKLADKSHCNYWIARCKNNGFSLEKLTIKTLQH